MLKLRGRLAGGITADSGEPEINMTPMIDMVFILLIFFLVTTTFIRDSGVKVDRPQAETAQALTKKSFMVAVDAQGGIHVGGRRVSLAAVRGLVERFLAEEPDGGVVVAADRTSLTGRLIEVIDQCRLAGAANLAIASTDKEK